MSMISRVEATPNRVRAAVRYLHAAEGKRLARDRFLNAISPPPLRSQRDPLLMANSVLGGCKELGLVEESDGHLALTAHVRDCRKLRSWNDEAFRWLVFERLMEDRAAPGADDGASANQTPLLMAWYLAQDPSRFDGRWEECLLNVVAAQRVRGGALDLTKVRLPVLQVWLVWCGLAWGCPPPVDCLPDPTEFIVRALAYGPTQQLLAPGGWGQTVPVGQALARLAELCPVLDGGRWARELRNVAAPPSLDEGRLSPALSLALARLEKRQWLRLDDHSDAAARVVLSLPGTARGVTHLTWTASATNTGR